MYGHDPVAGGGRRRRTAAGPARRSSSARVLRQDRRLHGPQRRARARPPAPRRAAPAPGVPPPARRPAGRPGRARASAAATSPPAADPPRPAAPAPAAPRRAGPAASRASSSPATAPARTSASRRRSASANGGVRPVAVGLAAPQVERGRRGAAPPRRRRPRPAGRARGPRGRRCAARRRRRAVHGQGVARPAADDVPAGGPLRPVRLQRAAQADDVRLQRLAGRHRRVTVPERLDEAVGADDARSAGRQDGQEQPLLGARHAHRRDVVVAGPPAVRGPRCAWTRR